jgi:hypothetical protein
MLPCHRLVLMRLAVLLFWLNVLISPAVASSTLLEVGATGGLPGFQEGELPVYLALHMTDAGLTEWRFEPAAGQGLPANYVLWSFTLKPYDGGEVYSHHPFHSSRGTSSGLHFVTLEARLYLNGVYQTLVVGQALMYGPHDRHLAVAVTEITRNLLGPTGAYRRIDAKPARNSASPGLRSRSTRTEEKVGADALSVTSLSLTSRQYCR